MENNFPRRNNLQKLTKAEKAIYDAIGEVEKVGAHALLTEATLLLQQAKDKLSDYVDSQPPVQTNDGPGDPNPHGCTDKEIWDPILGKCVDAIG